MSNKVLNLVVPCYNEEAVLPESSKQFLGKLKSLIKAKKIADGSRIIFVDDGSKDKTWDIIRHLSHKDKHYGGIKLSRNRGHQNALLAGLMSVRGKSDFVISLDADLQDDINAIDEMVDRYNQGFDIVYGVRSERKTDSFFKRTTALAFYKIMKLLGVDSIYNHADYRLTSSRVLEEFANFREVNLFLRGMFPLVGFKSTSVEYKRAARFAGESKYPLKKMLNFAWDGITSFSVKPLRIIMIAGFIISFVSILVAIYLITMKILGQTGQGLSFIAISIWFMGGVQIFSVGIIGEYIGKIYNETKQRPRFIIEQEI